ncbi:hypothetical protein C8J56DRAFT_92625 [Mycena floridula]|nr:hypothetical protein C8J56DRAFT_92625 [Mycena floridula]
METFPDIPDDIVRLILEAMVENDHLAAKNLVFVARNVQKWIQPLRFKAIFIGNEYRAKTFLQEITSNPDRLGIHVETITLMDNGAVMKHAKAIVSSLPNLITLGIWLSAEDIPRFFPFNSLSLRRLSLSLISLPEMKKAIPLLPTSITHLELFGRYSPLEPQASLIHLTRLTHLLVSAWNQDVRALVDSLPLSIPKSVRQILIFVGPHGDFRNLSPRFTSERRDPRIMFAALERHLCRLSGKWTVFDVRPTHWYLPGRPDI